MIVSLASRNRHRECDMQQNLSYRDLGIFTQHCDVSCDVKKVCCGQYKHLVGSERTRLEFRVIRER
jgi:hypothetical protein